jgi:ASC-1-like (ASCH) protein
MSLFPLFTHSIHCQEPWYSLIKTGKKRVEGRKGSLKNRSIKVNDTILFYCGPDSFLAKVEKIDQFASIEDYLKTVTLSEALPGIHSIEEGIRIYQQWSSPHEIHSLGFLALWLILDD